MSTILFEVQISGWAAIDAARERVAETLAGYADPAIREQVALAAHEMAENGIKYSVDQRVTLRIAIDANTVEVEAESTPVEAELTTLSRELERLAEVPDPLAYYRRRMHQTTLRQEARAGLGLARIRCEAMMSLEHVVEGGRLKLRAQRRL